MNFWHPDPFGRHGRSDIVEFADWYSGPFRNLTEWNMGLAVGRAGRAAGTWFALGYLEAYLGGASVSARYASGIRAISVSSSWRFLFPRVAVPLAVVTGVHAAGAGASYLIAGKEGVQDYNEFMSQPKHMPFRLSWSTARLYQHYLN